MDSNQEITFIRVHTLIRGSNGPYFIPRCDVEHTQPFQNRPYSDIASGCVRPDAGSWAPLNDDGLDEERSGDLFSDIILFMLLCNYFSVGRKAISPKRVSTLASGVYLGDTPTSMLTIWITGSDWLKLIQPISC